MRCACSGGAGTGNCAIGEPGLRPPSGASRPEGIGDHLRSGRHVIPVSRQRAIESPPNPARRRPRSSPPERLHSPFRHGPATGVYRTYTPDAPLVHTAHGNSAAYPLLAKCLRS